ncbi:SDR family oxidoreductase [Mesorhizobium sp. AA22]|uniref:SDR family oxidoreductase n=1 Tax=Mesorhizobium sp. AA22 TaxID=1854057 RepID=UPI0007EE036B|nr:SDR family oxidoreductase [Mesorhizobium sp. AA22]QIA22288.1 SDR family oxidoreductase [Mesorhizobium sp. AA22]
MYQKRALVVGSTGIVGLNVAEHLRDLGGWDIHGLSRRPPAGSSYMKSLKVDLLDCDSALKALADLEPTHIYYCTWTRGANEDENIRLNSAMLRTVLDAFVGKRCVQHVAVVTGTKHYLGPFENYANNTPVTPFRETAPRLPQKNFYYALEDVAMQYAAEHGFGWSVHRSHTIIGYAVGNLMNIGATLATHASICKASGQPFIFPGHPTAYRGFNDITDARLLAKQVVWASMEPNARNEAFNAANGDVFRWKQLWSVIAGYFGIEPAEYPERYNSLEEQMAGFGSAWDGLVKEHKLQPYALSELASPWHADLDLGRPMECVNSMAKSRALGFMEYQDTEQSFIDVFDRLRRERVIP